MSKSKKQPKLKDLINESFENFNGIATLKPVNSLVRNRNTQIPKIQEDKIKEGISSQAYQRMSNLTNVNDIKSIGTAISNIYSDLYDDGFEKDEVKAYLKMMIEKKFL